MYALGMTKDYIAGFFDGEGCIYWQPAGGSTGRRKLRVTIGQNDRRPLDLIAEQYGGKVVRLREGHWRWVVYTAQAETFLRDMVSRLIVKREAAEAALAVREAMPRRKR